jgi:hypothetical protein
MAESIDQRSSNEVHLPRADRSSFTHPESDRNTEKKHREQAPQTAFRELVLQP